VNVARHCLSAVGCALLPIFLIGCASHLHPADETELQFEGLARPAGVNAETWNRLTAGLGQSLQYFKTEKATATAPAQLAAQVSDLRVFSDAEGGVILLWSYLNPGDYDQNGEVNASDLTRLAINLGQTPESSGWQEGLVADGDSNQEVNIADVTSIGMNFRKTVDAYAVEYAASEAGPWNPVDTVPFGSRLTEGAGRDVFKLEIPAPPEGWYRVTPRHAESEGVIAIPTSWLPSQLDLIPAAFPGQQPMFSTHLARPYSPLGQPVPGGSALRIWTSAADQALTFAIVMQWDTPEEAVAALDALVIHEEPLVAGDGGFISDTAGGLDGEIRCRLGGFTHGSATALLVATVSEATGHCASKADLTSALQGIASELAARLPSGLSSKASRANTAPEPLTKSVSGLYPTVNAAMLELPAQTVTIKNGPAGQDNGTFKVGMRLLRGDTCGNPTDHHRNYVVQPLALGITLQDDTDLTGGANIRYHGNVRKKFSGEPIEGTPFVIQPQELTAYQDSTFDPIWSGFSTSIHAGYSYGLAQEALVGSGLAVETQFIGCGIPTLIELTLTLEDIDTSNWVIAKNTVGAILAVIGVVAALPTGGWSLGLAAAGAVLAGYDVYDVASNPGSIEPLGTVTAQWTLDGTGPKIHTLGVLGAQTQGITPYTATLRAEAFADAGIESYSWDLDGDGTYEHKQTTLSNSLSSQAHTYTTAGQREVSVMVRDFDGKESTATTFINPADNLTHELDLTLLGSPVKVQNFPDEVLGTGWSVDITPALPPGTELKLKSGSIWNSNPQHDWYFEESYWSVEERFLNISRLGTTSFMVQLYLPDETGTTVRGRSNVVSVTIIPKQ
jgi:hypothetical protein